MFANVFFWLLVYSILWTGFFVYRIKYKKDWYKWWHRPMARIMVFFGVLTILMSLAGLLGFIDP